MWSEVQERSGTVIDDLIPPELPVELEYLWLQYVEIRKGCVTVSYQDIDAYSRVSGYELTPWESDLMLKIDMKRVQTNG